MTRVVIRIDFDDGRYVGHGRIELMELIEQHGSIAQAAKAMGMSYKRAWYLADSINDTFEEPLIERRHGGSGGGSAQLSDFGRKVVRAYREMEKKSLSAFSKPLKTMESGLRPRSRSTKSAKPPRH